MIYDIMTVVRKELREYLAQRGGVTRSSGSRAGWLSLLVLVAVFGIFLPWQTGREWVETPVVILWAWVPLFLTTSITADAFAGERERHTLETLLASRLSDRAILFGKVLAAVAYGWGLTVVSLIVGLITVNVAFREGGLALYPLGAALGGLGVSLLAAGLAATAGVLVSLRASTVRQAAQTLSIAIMVLLFVPIFGIQALPPETTNRLMRWVEYVGMNGITLTAAGVLAVLDAALLWAGMARFQRARLILD
jgi:ABC-2 type transport system permease protein